MKRVVSLIVSILLGLTLFSGCGAQNKQEKLKVVCTIFPQYDIVRQIAGDSVELVQLLPYGMESHDFNLENLSAKDLETVSEADIFISVGGESDSEWVNKLRQKVGREETLWLELCDMTETLCIEHDHEGHSHEHSHQDIDEHIWTSPQRMMDVSSVIYEKLKIADPEISDVCDKGFAEFMKDLKDLDAEFKDLGKLAHKTAVFADRFSFRYMFHDYNFSYSAAFEGCSTTVDPSAKKISELTMTAIENRSAVILYMENSNTKYATKIAESVGVKVGMLHSCHNISKKQAKQGVSYVSLMKNNLKVLKEAVV